MPKRKNEIRPGELFVSSRNELGPGKAVANGPDGTLILEYFDSPGQDSASRYAEAVPRVGLNRFSFSAETRVFWETEKGWRSGRVMYSTPEREVAIRGRDWEGFVPEAKLYVRWHRPLKDPVGFAAGGLFESPLLADRRRPFLKSLLSQRAAARGMGSLLASGIELHEHQIEVARRVLDDPVLRYLLADEVGLGKTIEAGLILRQLLLDHKTLDVQLILPPFLVEQWRRELKTKFLVSEFDASEFRFGRDDEPESWRAADIVIVDEAHNIARLHDHPDAGLRNRYESLRGIAIESPRLLLLSATPVLHNEATFLAMFHLLDPDIYSPRDTELLRSKLAARSGLGRILLGLRATVPMALLRRRLQELGDLFPGDDALATLLQRANHTLEDGSELLERDISAIRVHVTEVYRLSRRMLRTRRTEALNATYRVTGRRSPDLIRHVPSWFQEIDSLLDLWRQELLADVEGDEPSIRSASRLLSHVMSLMPDPVALQMWARGRKAEKISDAEAIAVDRLLRRLEGIDPITDVALPLADELSYALGGREYAVIFCATSELARDFAGALSDLIGKDAVHVHLGDSDPEEAEAAVRSFENPATSARVLVCDSSAEEGRNLQFADVLVHVGVPSDPNRLEQRIGRIDRWSTKLWKWRSLIFDDGSESLSSAWRTILTHGFGVFDHSIASLQHVVEVATSEAWRLIFLRGSSAVTEANAVVSQMLDSELQSIREQDALDAIEAVQDERAPYRSLLAVERDIESFARISDELFASEGESGNLRFRRLGKPTEGVGSYLVRDRGMTASRLPLIPAWRILRDFIPFEGHRGTFVRDIAVAEGSHLYRYGDGFINAVADFLWHDDRGRAWGMWRHVPDWSEPEHPWFRFDYHIEAATDAAIQAVAHLRQGAEYGPTSRQADGFLPPVVITTWLDAAGKEPSRELIEVLEAPYDKWRNPRAGRDYNLSRARIHWMYDLIPQDEWVGTWRKIEGMAAESILESPGVRGAIESATAQARRSLEARVHQLELRTSRADESERVALAEELEVTRVVNRELIAGLREPKAHLDSVGVIVVSSEVPQSGELSID